MTADRKPAAFALSLTLHVLVVAILLLFTYTMNRQSKEVPKIFELVAGEGNDYMATKAPRIGTPDAVKLNVPAPPVPKPEAAKPEPAPVTPAPTPVAPPVPKSVPAKEPPSPAKKILTQLYNADRKAKREVAKEREEEQKRLTKEEFDRQNKAKADGKSTPPKIAKIDTPGIPKGVAGGSPENTKAGANGKALTADEGSRMERYQSALMAALHDALEKEKPPGLSESLVTTAEFHWNADGTLSGVRITKSSGSREFDDAVRAAIRQVSGSMGPRPDGKSEVVEIAFRAKEQDGG